MPAGPVTNPPWAGITLFHKHLARQGVSLESNAPRAPSVIIRLGISRYSGRKFMPLYEYSCHRCGKSFEVRQKFAEAPLTVHEGCGGQVERIIFASALQFKGSGFYVNDYGRGVKSRPTNGSSAKSESKTESKGEPKPESKNQSQPAPSTSSPEK